jgi:hypothetical protein
MGMALTVYGQEGISLALLSHPRFSGWIYTLLAIGFLTKTAALGLHIWLPGAHAEAESDVSPMVSGILLKAGAFGLVVLFLAMGGENAAGHPLLYALGWLGALTALGGNLLAVFQEDAKRLLAYSSVGNLGYILFAGDKALGLAVVEIAKWDTKHFGIKMGNMTHFIVTGSYADTERIYHLLLVPVIAECKKRGIHHLTAKVDLGDVPAVHVLHHKKTVLFKVEIPETQGLYALHIGVRQHHLRK